MVPYLVILVISRYLVRLTEVGTESKRQVTARGRSPAESPDFLYIPGTLRNQTRDDPMTDDQMTLMRVGAPGAGQYCLFVVWSDDDVGDKRLPWL